MELTRPSQASTRAGTGKGKNTWLEGEHPFKKQHIVKLTKLYCLPAPQKTIQEASNLKNKNIKKGREYWSQEGIQHMWNTVSLKLFIIKQVTDKTSGTNTLFMYLNCGDWVLGLGESGNSCLNWGADSARGNFQTLPMISWLGRDPAQGK